jgi:hypothetical protein
LLFGLIYFMYIDCFWPADPQVESEPVENFQDIYFEDLEQQQAGFERQVSLTHFVPIFSYLSIGLHASGY